MIQPAILPLVAPRNGVFSTTLGFAGFSNTLTAARMQLRASPGASGPALLEINTTTPTTNGSLITILNATPINWSISLLINELDLAALPAGTPNISFSYDLVLTDSSGFFAPYVGGLFTVMEGVTR